MKRWLACLWILGCGMSTAYAQQAAKSDAYVPFKNTEFKFATEIPAGWGSERPAPSALVFSGPKGGEEYYTTINFQVVQRRTQGEDGVAVRARDIQRQWATAAKYELISDEKIDLAGAPAVRLRAQYQGPGSSDMYKQEQIVCEKGAYFYLVSYTAPVDLYAKHYGKMERVVKAFQFLP